VLQAWQAARLLNSVAAFGKPQGCVCTYTATLHMMAAHLPAHRPLWVCRCCRHLEDAIAWSCILQTELLSFAWPETGVGVGADLLLGWAGGGCVLLSALLPHLPARCRLCLPPPLLTTTDFFLPVSHQLFTLVVVFRTTSCPPPSWSCPVISPTRLALPPARLPQCSSGVSALRRGTQNPPTCCGGV
jgi:hypothetical protein